MGLADDQDSVEEFVADGADEAFGDRVRPRCRHRRVDDGDVDGGEDGVEGWGELAVAVADQERKRRWVSSSAISRLRLLGQPGCGRVRGDTEDVYLSGGVLDDEELVAEFGELAVHAPVAPRRILGGQARSGHGRQREWRGGLPARVGWSSGARRDAGASAGSLPE